MSSSEDCSSTIEGPSKKKIKKGSRNVDQHKRNNIKKSRVKGEAYTSHSGKEIPLWQECT